MKVLRITVSALDVDRQTEPEFQKKFTKRLLKAGFDLRDPIIRQPRSDVEGADFIQLRYGFLDKFDVDIEYFGQKIKDWFKHNFLKQKDELEDKKEDSKHNLES